MSTALRLLMLVDIDGSNGEGEAEYGRTPSAIGNPRQSADSQPKADSASMFLPRHAAHSSTPLTTGVRDA